MLFNSYEYILCFLPISLIIYFILNKYKLTLASKTWLVITSLFFYGWWNIIYLPLITGSILFNYAIGTSLLNNNSRLKARKIFLYIGIIGNVLLLGFFKYSDFFIVNVNNISGLDLQTINIVLPLGISFFTFTQIAYLVDTYNMAVKEYDLLNYSLFVTYFPHLLAGPIIHHSEMMPQFNRIKNKVFNYKNFSLGIFLFAIGLFKKVIIADSFAVWANRGYAKVHLLTLIDAWITSLSYALQLYFDFSGYTDMAIGSALMFNIVLPINFNTPYLAGNIQDFWRRWHITLSRFLRDYVYIPLGGNRISEGRTLCNLVATFLIGGIWHGAGWTYILWGALHGIAMVAHRLWKKSGLVIPKILAWFITFNFVNFAWIFFRAKDFDEALSLLRAMIGLNGISLPSSAVSILGWLTKYGVRFAGGEWNMSIVTILPIFIIIAIFFKNSNQMIRDFKPSLYSLFGALFLLGTSLFSLLTIKSEFIYFNF